MVTAQAGPSSDIHHKMSKKIAQLTKVIFTLHSKIEENFQYQNSLVGAYKKEIETIFREANNVINHQKDALDKIKEGNNFKSKIREQEDKHNSVSQEKQFEEYQNRVKDRESLIEKEYQQKVADFKFMIFLAFNLLG